MGNGLVNSPVSRLISEAMRHYAQGNVVSVITIQGTGGDKDLGIAGNIVETAVVLQPEPWINAVAIDMVLKSGGSFRYSDYKMTVAKASLTANTAFDKHTEFTVNGDRYIIITVTSGPSAWEFVIRRKTAEPVTP